MQVFFFFKSVEDDHLDLSKFHCKMPIFYGLSFARLLELYLDYSWLIYILKEFLFPGTPMDLLLKPGDTYNPIKLKFLLLIMARISFILTSVWSFDSSLQSHRNSETRSFLAILCVGSSSVNILTSHLLV